MMNEKYKLLENLLLEARKASDRFALSIYSTMKGDVDNTGIGKSDQDYDDLVENYALKSKKNLEEFKPADYEKEIELLTPFLPKIADTSEIKDYISTLKSEDVPSKQWMGRVMRNFKGLDPQLVKSLINEMN